MLFFCLFAFSAVKLMTGELEWHCANVLLDSIRVDVIVWTIVRAVSYCIMYHNSLSYIYTHVLHCFMFRIEIFMYELLQVYF